MEIVLFTRCLLVLLLGSGSVSLKVKVAVYEHVVVSPNHPEGNFTRLEAFEWMSENLAVFAERSKEAARQGAKIIVFPEYGITGFDQTRNSMLPFLEDIPAVKELWNPCKTPNKHPDTLVLRNLSCLARDNKIYIVANMGDIKYCDRKIDRSCPKDGRYQFNTNVVLDENGTLIARYHKRHMYDETPLFDPAPSEEYIYFQTPYGTFGTIVCFDIMHYFPTQELIIKFDIRNLLVTSAWNAFFPFVLPVQMFAGLSKRNDINVIAANIRNFEYFMAGSGIFGPGVEKSSSLNFSDPDGVLLVAEIETSLPKPPRHQQLQPISNNLEGVQIGSNGMHVGQYKYGMNMSFTLLPGDAGSRSACYDQICCVAEYNFRYRDPTEVFILSAVDFNMVDIGSLHMQFCAVHRCLTDELSSCGGYLTSAESTFTDIKIQGFFDQGVVFPFVSTTEFNNGSLQMEMDHYKFDKSKAILESHEFEHALLAAVVYCSVYDTESVAPVSGSSIYFISSDCSTFFILLSCIFYEHLR